MPSEKHRQPLYQSGHYTGWAGLRAELFQSDLIAPTDVLPTDVQFTRRLTVYRVMLMLMLVAVGFISLEASLRLPITHPMLWLSAVFELFLVATFTWIYSHRRILLPPVIALSGTTALVLWAIAQGGDHHTLWLFPLLIAMAGLLPTTIALGCGLLALSTVVAIRGLGAEVEVLAEEAALVSTWLISLAVMRLMTRQTDELADLALTDPLTGAYNRRYLVPQAQRNIADFQRYSRLSALLMIDIDHFKAINDQFGHAEGDRVLKEVVSLIDNRIRGVDMLFRLGGEEFVVLLTEVGSQTAAKIADELRRGIEDLALLAEHKVTVSIGVCDVTGVESPEDWLAQVDQAMYTAKTSGRNQVCGVPSQVSDNTALSSVPVWR